MAKAKDLVIVESPAKAKTIEKYLGMAAAAVFVLILHMDIEALPYSYAVGWVLMLLYEVPALVRCLKDGTL